MGHFCPLFKIATALSVLKFQVAYLNFCWILRDKKSSKRPIWVITVNLKNTANIQTYCLIEAIILQLKCLIKPYLLIQSWQILVFIAFNSFCCATLFASTSLICSLVKPEWFSKYFLQGLRFTVGVSLALIYTFFLWYSPTKNQYNIQQFAFFI